MLTYSDNLKQWSATLRQYAAFSKLDWADIANKKALDLAIKAIKNTQRGDRGKITSLPSMLGRNWYREVVAWMKLHGGLERAVIKAKRGVRAGGLGSWRYTVAMASKRLIAKRLQAIGFVKSGWLPAIGLLSQVADASSKGKAYGAARVFSPKGYANAAKPDFNPFALIANTAASSVKSVGSTSSKASSGGGQRVHDIIQAGAKLALQESDADMRKYIERKISERIRFFTG